MTKTQPQARSHIWIALTTLALLLLAVGATAAKPTTEKIKPQTTCPVMGGKVLKDLYVDKDGKRIYLCCKGCVDPVTADFAKYEKKIEAKGETVAHAQTKCPVMGGKIVDSLYVDQGGKRIYLCCGGCIKPVTENFEKYAEKVRSAGEYVADTPETK